MVSLKSADGDTVTTHLTFDSDALPATGTAYQSNANIGESICGPPMAFFTDSRGYFVEVLLTKSTSTANPGVRIIKILDSQQYD